MSPVVSNPSLRLATARGAGVLRRREPLMRFTPGTIPTPFQRVGGRVALSSAAVDVDARDLPAILRANRRRLSDLTDAVERCDVGEAALDAVTDAIGDLSVDEYDRSGRLAFARFFARARIFDGSGVRPKLGRMQLFAGAGSQDEA
jgi:hypothetical protein